ncbi:MAG: hypothetical protein M1824_005863 [Vezdaea acicularis]|nr:MAG: hypothetical protein M1824_005863 [Vezdaea acicularis]
MLSTLSRIQTALGGQTYFPHRNRSAHWWGAATRIVIYLWMLEAVSYAVSHFRDRYKDDIVICGLNASRLSTEPIHDGNRDLPIFDQECWCLPEIMEYTPRCIWCLELANLLPQAQSILANAYDLCLPPPLSLVPCPNSCGDLSRYLQTTVMSCQENATTTEAYNACSCAPELQGYVENCWFCLLGWNQEAAEKVLIPFRGCPSNLTSPDRFGKPITIGPDGSVATVTATVQPTAAPTSTPTVVVVPKVIVSGPIADVQIREQSSNVLFTYTYATQSLSTSTQASSSPSLPIHEYATGRVTNASILADILYESYLAILNPPSAPPMTTLVPTTTSTTIWQATTIHQTLPYEINRPPMAQPPTVTSICQLGYDFGNIVYTDNCNPTSTHLKTISTLPVESLSYPLLGLTLSARQLSSTSPLFGKATLETQPSMLGVRQTSSGSQRMDSSLKYLYRGGFAACIYFLGLFMNI